MEDFNNRTAFVTGAASGIGFALCRALVDAGANVMMADIDDAALNRAAASLAMPSERVQTVVCDVVSSEAVVAAANATIASFGKVHLVFNNAGVGMGGESGQMSLKDWQWIVDINLMGVVHGVETFLPLLRAHGEGGHIVNTASMAGHIASPGMAPYHATKFAVVGYSESLREEFKGEDIGISVLCPTWVKSNIYNTANHRPSAAHDEVPELSSLQQSLKRLVDDGMSAERFAALVLKSVVARRFYIFNDQQARAAIDARRKAILSDYDACLSDLETVGEHDR